jgi:hypothetical protein
MCVWACVHACLRTYTHTHTQLLVEPKLYLFTYGLFNDAASTSDYIVLNNKITNG